jgi:tRNA dimethylallyltransferase
MLQPAATAGSAASQTVIVVAGPTACGKSALALALAGEFGGVIVNADSMQVYRELRFLTARPTPEDEAAAPHRLYGFWPAATPCSAAAWRELALGEIAAAHAAGKLPILVGGSGLYLHALWRGLAPVPDIPPAARTAARRLYEELGGAEFHRRLQALDPVMARRLNPGDSQRLVRAYEVVTATGRSLAAWQGAGAGGAGHPFAVVHLDPPRPELYRRCDARVLAMIRQGALAEVRALLDLRLDPGLPAMKAVGVRELGRHLAGTASLEAAVAATQQATRRYAKRQLTWFRNRLSSNFIAENISIAQFSVPLNDNIFAFVRKTLLTTKAAAG